MRIELWLLLVIGLLIIGVLVYQGIQEYTSEYPCSSEDPCVVVEKVYQGPVPQEANEDHFRKTGETIRR